MLEAQRIFGNCDPQIRTTDRSAFGITLFKTVPEDDPDIQPLLLGGHMLVADVRIDNRDELSRALGLPAEKRAAPDAELLLRAWLNWGESCLDQIVGDYAFALYEMEPRKLTLARDWIGQRPLFFAHQADDIAFASAPSGILALPQFRTGFNRRALALAAADIPPEGESTYFQSIRRVLPGQIVTISPRGLEARQYWQPCLDGLRLNRAEDYVDAYREVLDNAVNARMRRLAGPIATHLSSGLDSSAVAATAARLRHEGDPIIAFTAAPRLGFREQARRGRIADESDAAALTAAMHDMQHEIVRSSGSSLTLIRHQVATSQEPRCNILNQDWFWSVERLARDKGSTILLTGEYGNATLNAGGIRTLTEWIRKMRWATWWKEARCMARRPDAHWRGVLFNSFEPWLPQAVRRDLYTRFLDVEMRSNSVFLTAPWVRELGDQLESEFLGSVPSSYAEARISMLRRLDEGSLIKGSLARHGIDNRAPLADRRLAEFSLRLPPDQMLAGGISQPLARKALSDRVPQEVLGASARGYQSADWFENVDRQEVRAMAEEIAASPTASELIDLERIHDAVAHWPSEKAQGFAQYQRLAIDLPNAIATGFFILEAERWMNSPLPAHPAA